MRAAPPVQMTCQAGGVGPVATALLSAMTLAGLLAWLVLPGEPSRWLRVAVASPFVLIAAALSLAMGRRGAGAASLVWDGSAWKCGERPVQVAVQLDLGPWLLLRLQGADAGHSWLGLRLSHCGASPHRCRAALYAHGGERPTVRHE